MRPSAGDRGQPTVSYRYEFVFPDGTNKEFLVELDGETLALRNVAQAPHPEWTQLGFHQCSNCPLSSAEHEHCPIAKNIVPLVGFFGGHFSYEQVAVRVTSKQREYVFSGGLQTAVSSLLGIYMVTSGCPILDHLRPMVAMHLPFMSRQETLYRTVSMYLTAQLFISRRGGAATWDLAPLRRILEQVRTVNVGFRDRLRVIQRKDANLNALVILCMLGDFPQRRSTETDLAHIERAFAALTATLSEADAPPCTGRTGR